MYVNISIFLTDVRMHESLYVILTELCINKQLMLTYKIVFIICSF